MPDFHALISPFDPRIGASCASTVMHLCLGIAGHFGASLKIEVIAVR
jgi:hypothetical protein